MTSTRETCSRCGEMFVFDAERAGHLSGVCSACVSADPELLSRCWDDGLCADEPAHPFFVAGGEAAPRTVVPYPGPEPYERPTHYSSEAEWERDMRRRGWIAEDDAVADTLTWAKLMVWCVLGAIAWGLGAWLWRAMA